MTRTKRPPTWLLVVLFVLAAVVVFLRLGDAFGDRGVRNAISGVLVLLAAALACAWFVFLSGFARRARAGVALGVVLPVAAFAALVEVRGYSGSMIPDFGWRFAKGRGPLVPVEPLEAGLDVATSAPTDFPGFLGARRDAHVRGVTLARDWDARPPELLWRHPIGAGWSGFAIVNGVAVTLEQRGDEETLSAYELATGALRWVHGWPAHFDQYLAGEGPRSTPTIAGGRVYALGAEGDLVCVDGARGELVWQRDLLADFGVTPELEEKHLTFGRANSPLLTDGRLVVPAGGVAGGHMAGLVAYDPATGGVLWEGPPRQISYSSPTRATLAGVDQLLIVNEDTLSGHEPATGALLWEHDWPGVSSNDASSSQAVPLPPKRVFVSKGYSIGAMLLELDEEDDGTLTPRVVWADGRALRTKFTNVVVHAGHLYGLSDGILECVVLEDGARVWRAGRYGHGQILLVGELLLVLTEEGELVLVEPTPDEPARELGRLQALEGRTWNTLALSGDLLAIRNGEEAAVYRLPTE
jgi:outer membrane protein assembly factor BamB